MVTKHDVQSRGVSDDFRKQVLGYGLTTAEILYRRPDRQWLLQSYVWQNYDMFPKFPVLCDFLADAELDAIGVFGYSSEEGTEACRLDGQLPPEEIAARRARVADLAEELVAQRAAERIGERVEVLVEEADGELIGRAAHQGPEVDGNVSLITNDHFVRGDLVNALVCDSQGIDLVATTVVDQQRSRQASRNSGHRD